MFQLALTILQKNKDKIMECNDEGDSISLLATYLEMIESPDRKIEVTHTFCIKFKDLKAFLYEILNRKESYW